MKRFLVRLPSHSVLRVCAVRGPETEARAQFWNERQRKLFHSSEARAHAAERHRESWYRKISNQLQATHVADGRRALATSPSRTLLIQRIADCGQTTICSTHAPNNPITLEEAELGHKWVP